MIFRRFTSTLVAHATKDGALRRDSVAKADVAKADITLI